MEGRCFRMHVNAIYICAVKPVRYVHDKERLVMLCETRHEMLHLNSRCVTMTVVEIRLTTCILYFILLSRMTCTVGSKYSVYLGLFNVRNFCSILVTYATLHINIFKVFSFTKLHISVLPFNPSKILHGNHPLYHP